MRRNIPDCWAKYYSRKQDLKFLCNIKKITTHPLTISPTSCLTKTKQQKNAFSNNM